MTPGDQAVLQLAYQYGDAQEIVQRKNNQQTIDYQYDAVNRLQQAAITEANDDKSSETYQFDANNNIVSNQQQSSWIYNSAGQLTQKGADRYFYDNNGNQIKTVIAGVTRHYIYNIKDRLIRIEDVNNSVIASYVYDPMGRRLSKTVSGKTTYYLYNAQGLIAEYDAAGQELNSYGYRPNNIWGTDPVFLKTGEQAAKKYYYYHNDHLGTPYLLTDNTGFVVWSAKSDSFGNTRLTLTNKITNNLRFPGQYYDAESGLHYNGHRYYDPNIGRYITSDPIGLAGGINTYAYAAGNPVGLMDPYGLLFSPNSMSYGEAAGQQAYNDVINQAIDSIRINDVICYYLSVLPSWAKGSLTAGFGAGVVGAGGFSLSSSGISATASLGIGGGIKGHWKPAIFDGVATVSKNWGGKEGASHVSVRIAGSAGSGLLTTASAEIGSNGLTVVETGV